MTSLLSLDDLKHPDIAKRIQEKAKIALVGMVPDDYIDEIVKATTADLFAFKLNLQRDAYPVGYDHQDGWYKGTSEKIVTVYSLDKYLAALTRGDNYKNPVFEIEQVPMHVPLFDEDGKQKTHPERSYQKLFSEEETPMPFEWRAQSGKLSFFYEVITEAAKAEGQRFLIEQVGTYFKPGMYDMNGRPSFNPTTILQEQLKEAMPALLESVFGNLLANGLGNFQMHLQQRMRNGGF